jgi:hypothetical protein
MDAELSFNYIDGIHEWEIKKQVRGESFSGCG